METLKKLNAELDRINNRIEEEILRFKCTYLAALDTRLNVVQDSMFYKLMIENIRATDINDMKKLLEHIFKKPVTDVTFGNEDYGKFYLTHFTIGDNRYCIKIPNINSSFYMDVDRIKYDFGEGDATRYLKSIGIILYGFYEDGYTGFYDRLCAFPDTIERPEDMVNFINIKEEE